MNKKQKKLLYRIIAAVVLVIALELAPVDRWLKFALYLIPYLIIGYETLVKAVKGIKNRQPFDENFPYGRRHDRRDSAGRLPRGRLRHGVLPDRRAF